MRRQTVTWTALPNGVRGSGSEARLSLTALLTPRLWTDEGLPAPTLSQFPDFLDWPTTALQFEVQFGTLPPVPATRVSDPPDSTLWRALFGPATFVRPYLFPPLVDRPIRSYSVGNVNAFLRKQYATFAAMSAEEFPNAETLLGVGALGPIAFGAPEGSLPGDREAPDEAELSAVLDGLLAEGQAVPPAPEDPPLDFFQARLFHQPFSAKRLAKLPSPTIDFHQMLSVLDAYPVLLRRLGLAHDLEVPRSAAPSGTVRVQVIVRWQAAGANSTTVPDPDENPPRRLMTRSSISAESFTAAPRPGSAEIADGMLRLDDAGAYEAVQIDVDGAAIKTMDFAAEIARATSVRQTDDTPTAYSLPSLRSAGIGVARVGQALRTHAGFVRATDFSTALEAGSDVLLNAEDLVRGYAIDVWDSESGRWRSLCERVVVYTFLNAGTVLEVEDEGWVSAGLTSAADGSSPEFRQSEFLFRWRGWSLAAPSPGKVMDQEGQPVAPPNAAVTEFQLETRAQANPGSLPSLRFGRRYRLRARAVDLAGNRRSLGDPALSGFLHATPEIVYGRFEPVASPGLFLRQARTEGESAKRLVLRSNFDSPPAPASVERHVVPPKTAADMGEAHGLFDDPTTGSVAGEAYARFLTPPGGNEVRPWEGDSVEAQGTVDASDYGLPFVDADALRLPYLPDLFSRGAVLRGLPGTSGAVVVDFALTPAWPEARPFRLVVDEGSGAPDSSPGVLRVHLPKSETVQVRLSSRMNAGDVAQAGLFRWLVEQGLPTAALQNAGAAGTHWMLTPYRRLTLVHAVRQPLLTPEFQSFTPLRNLGESVATFSGTLQVHRKSTDKVDFLAEWDEPVDALDDPAWCVIHGTARPFDLPVPPPIEPGEEVQLSVPSSRARHEFGDTKHRRVRYSAVASSRFSEYFLERKNGVTLAANVPFPLDARGIVAGSEAVRATGGGATFVRGQDYRTNDGDGTITAIASLGQPVDIAYIARPITRETKEPVTVDVPNAARPASPKVLYAVPTFGWTTPTSGPSQFQSARSGGGLRVYMDRPWWSSGEGELLGVVLYRPPPSPPPRPTGSSRT